MPGGLPGQHALTLRGRAFSASASAQSALAGAPSGCEPDAVDVDGDEPPGSAVDDSLGGGSEDIVVAGGSALCEVLGCVAAGPDPSSSGFTVESPMPGVDRPSSRVGPVRVARSGDCSLSDDAADCPAVSLSGGVRVPFTAGASSPAGPAPDSVADPGFSTARLRSGPSGGPAGGAGAGPGRGRSRASAPESLPATASWADSPVSGATCPARPEPKGGCGSVLPGAVR